MWILGTVSSIGSVVTTSLHRGAIAPAPQMDVLAVFGFLTAIVTLLCWMHRRQSRSVVAALAVCLAAMAVYAFLQGAWPLGIVESVWSVATVRQWYEERQIGGRRRRGSQSVFGNSPNRWASESRMIRMFDSN